MTRPFEAWRRSLALWGLPFLFCLLNLLVLGFYFSFYAGEVERLEERNEIAAGELVEISRRSQDIEAKLDRIEAQDQNIDALYRDHFQTEAERFTRAIQEVKELARDAGLNPTAFGYPQQVLEEEGLIQRQIQFSVEGTYRQLRTFVNFLELTDQFLTLNAVSLSESGPDRLRIRLTLSTVFANRPLPSAAAARDSDPDAELGLDPEGAGDSEGDPSRDADDPLSDPEDDASRREAATGETT